MNLYEITGDYLSLMDMMQDSDADEQILTDTLEGIEGEFEEKADAYAKIIRNLTADIDAIKTEEERLSSKRKSLENRIKWLKENLQRAMEITNKTKFKTSLFSFGIQNNRPSVVIDAVDMEDVPEEFLRYRDPEIDKAKLKDAIDAGRDLSGIAHLETSKSLRIR